MPLQKDELERLKVLAENLTYEDMAALNIMHATLGRYTSDVPNEGPEWIDNYMAMLKPEWIEAGKRMMEVGFCGQLLPMG